MSCYTMQYCCFGNDQLKAVYYLVLPAYAQELLVNAAVCKAMQLH